MAEHGRPKVRLKWARTSGTSCAVACHAASERLLVPLGRQGNGKRRLNLSIQPPDYRCRSILIRHHYGDGSLWIVNVEWAIGLGETCHGRVWVCDESSLRFCKT